MKPQLYEFLVAPRPENGRGPGPLIKVQFTAYSQYEAKQQAYAIYGPNSERSPIVPKK